MSAVDDVAARIQRLDELRTTKSAQLRQLQHELRFNALAGVDERLDNGQSVARLEVKVEGGRNLLFKAGFLSAQRTYVRIAVEVVTCNQKGHPPQGSTVMEQKLTTKRPVSFTPRWSELLLFEGLPAALGTLRIDVMQEEKIGSDEVVGTVIMPLARLQDQRSIEKWHVLEKPDKSTTSEVLLGCRFCRSPISALQLELELLQNQMNELHLFVGRHQNLVEQPKNLVTVRSKPLQGKEVVPEETPEQTVSTRFSAVASFPPSMRKRECVENVSMNVERHEAPRVKRQRYVLDTDKQVSSLSDRLASWLLPTTPSTASTFAAKTKAAADTSMTSPNVIFPFKQRQPAPASRRSRRTGRVFSTTSPKTPSALQAIEKWLFTDKEGKPREFSFGRQAPPY